VPKECGFVTCRLRRRRDQDPAGLLSWSARHAENETQPQNRFASAIVGIGADASESSTPDGQWGRRTGVSNSQSHALQRHQPAASAGRQETGHSLAQLAHAQAHSRHVVPGGWRIVQRCSSAVRPLEDVHKARTLYPFSHINGQWSKNFRDW